MVNIQTADRGYMISQKLQGQDCQDGRQHPRRIRQPEDMVSHVPDELVSVGCDRNDHAAAGLGLLDLRDHLLVPGIPGDQANDRHAFVDERDGAVFHLAGGVTLGMDIRDLFKFEGALVRDRHVETASEVEAVADVLQDVGDLFDLRLALQSLADQVGYEAQVGNQASCGFHRR